MNYSKLGNIMSAISIFHPATYLALVVLVFPTSFVQAQSVAFDQGQAKRERINDLGSQGDWYKRRSQPFESFFPPSKLTLDYRNTLFGNMPEEFHAPSRAKLVELETAFSDRRKELYSLMRPPSEFETEKQRWEGFEDFARHGLENVFRPIYYDIYMAFSRYPNVYNPARKAEYWQESAEDLIEILDRQLTWLNKKEKSDVEELERLKAVSPEQAATALLEDRRFSRRRPWRAALPAELAEKRRERLAAGKTAYTNPFLDCVLLAPEEIDDDDIVLELQERMKPRNDWPELDALHLTARDVEGWDGSTSLEDVARLLVAKLCHGNIESEHWSPAADFAPKEFHFRLEPNFYSEKTKDERSAAKKNLNENPIYLALAKRRFSKTHESIINVIEGRCNLSFSTRMPSADELALAEKRGVELLCTPFAMDAFVFVVNHYNSVTNLTSEQIRDIFSGKLNDWRDVGGFGEIVALGRNRNSGSEELLRDIVMKDRPVREDLLAMTIMSMQGVFDQLAASSASIGYTVWYYERNIAVSVASRVLKIDGAEPTMDSVVSGKYPFAYQTVLIRRKPKDAKDEKTEAFVRWLLSREGQELVRESGYAPLNVETTSAEKEKSTERNPIN